MEGDVADREKWSEDWWKMRFLPLANNRCDGSAELRRGLEQCNRSSADMGSQSASDEVEAK